MKVEVQMSDGRVKMLTPAQARAMVFIGKGQYLRRDMVAAPQAVPMQPAVTAPAAPALPEADTVSEDAPKKRGRPRKVKDTE